MKKRLIVFDTTEIVAVVNVKNEDDPMKKKGNPVIMNLTYDQISKISFEPCIEKKMFKSIPSEKIVLKLKKMVQPVEYPKMENKEFYEEYKEGFREFAKQNRIELLDETV